MTHSTTDTGQALQISHVPPGPKAEQECGSRTHPNEISATLLQCCFRLTNLRIPQSVLATSNLDGMNEFGVDGWFS